MNDSVGPLNTYDVGLVQAQAYRALSIYMVECLRPFKLNVTEWAALGRVCDSGEMRMSDLAAQLGVSVPRSIFLVARLERAGYVARSGDSHDRRVVRIACTPIGRAKKEQIEPIIRENMRHYMLGVKPRDLAAYIKVLQFLATKLYR
jgi:DNA-binding MarR family transcriptional regulator